MSCCRGCRGAIRNTRSTTPATFSTARAAAFEKDREYAFAIVQRDSGRVVGGTGINQLDMASARANLGYWIRTTAAGRGYATEATLALAPWAFEALALSRIEIVAAVGNEASQRVAAKVGATRECVARNRLCVRGRPTDAVVFSLIPSDLANR